MHQKSHKMYIFAVFGPALKKNLNRPARPLNRVVPGEGLEPSHLSALEPKSSVSANSTTRASVSNSCESEKLEKLRSSFPIEQGEFRKKISIGVPITAGP